MRRIVSMFMLIAASAYLVACASVESFENRTNIDDIVSRPDVVSFPYARSDDGQLVIPVSINGHPPSLFAIDTGATKTAIFRKASTGFKIPVLDDENIMVHGLVQSSDQPVITLESLHLGHHEFMDHQIAVLENRTSGSQLGREIKGLVGLDVLSSFRLFLDADEERLYLIPTSVPQVRKPGKWKHIALHSNPYVEDGRGLKYFMMSFNGHESPALLDSGSALNFMNWEVAKHPQIRRYKKRLQKKWKVEGATGTFDPTMVVRLESIYSGDKYWQSPIFVVTDVSSLDILGISGKPFAIAGIDMLASDSFYLDFANNTLYLKDRTNAGMRRITGSRFSRSINKNPPNVITFGDPYF